MPLSEEEVYRGQTVRSGEVMDEDKLPSLVTDGALIGGLTRAEIDIQIETALRHPRSMTKVQRAVETLATLDAETALSCVYRRPQKVWDEVARKQVDSFIEGPSARFAEIVLASWGNARVASRQTDVTKDDVEATGIFHDLETNVAWAKSVRRPIVSSKGVRFPQHLIATTANAAASIALRNAILAGVPKAVWGNGYAKAYRAGRGDATTLVARRSQMIAMFKEAGVSQADVFTLLGVNGLEDISVDLMHTGAGLFNSIRDGEATLEELLAQIREPIGRRGLDAAFGDAPKEPAPPKPQATRQRASAAPIADKAKPTPESATDASTPSAVETSGQKAPSAASPNGEAGFEIQEAEREALVQAAKNAETSLADARVEIVGKQYVIVQDHEAEPIDSELEQPADYQTVDEALEDHHMPINGDVPVKPHETEAFKNSAAAFLDRVSKAGSWLDIKPMVTQVRKWQVDNNADPDAIKPLLLAAFRRTREISDPVKPSEDPVYARIYLLCEPPPEEAQKHYRALVRAAQYVRLTDDEKDVIAAEFEAYGG
jgi:hypothetical protein